MIITQCVFFPIVCLATTQRRKVKPLSLLRPLVFRAMEWSRRSSRANLQSRLGLGLECPEAVFLLRNCTTASCRSGYSTWIRTGLWKNWPIGKRCLLENMRLLRICCQRSCERVRLSALVRRSWWFYRVSLLYVSLWLTIVSREPLLVGDWLIDSRTWGAIECRRSVASKNYPAI